MSFLQRPPNCFVDRVVASDVFERAQNCPVGGAPGGGVQAARELCQGLMLGQRACGPCYGVGGKARHEARIGHSFGREIEQIGVKVSQRGMTLVPLSMYLTDGRVKLELGLARGKEGVDKRHAMADRDARRQIERAMKEQRR